MLFVLAFGCLGVSRGVCIVAGIISEILEIVLLDRDVDWSHGFDDFPRE